MVIASIVAFGMFGLKPGIDFTGGSLMEIEFSVDRPNSQSITEAFAPLNLTNIVIQPIGDNGMIIRSKDIDEKTHQDMLKALKDKFSPAGATAETKVLEEKRFDSIGPTVGQELKNKSIWAVVIVVIAIIIYIAWAFRKVSKPVASWKYGVIATISLIHDIIIVIGAFALLGRFYNIEVNAPFIAALLTIFGYSNNDTIVVFDRIRENLKRRVGEEFDAVVDQSINEVIVRSINTSFTVLLALFAIFAFGGKSIHDFTLALIIGVTIGTYSSIFLASPLLVIWQKISAKK
jgi:preprotein translocase subunit SecF